MSNDQDQAIDQSANDQGKVTTEETKEPSKFNVGGQEMTGDELAESYKKLQGEYTKSRQELSNTKKNSELSDEDKIAIDFLKKNDFLTKDDLEGYAAEKKQEANLSKIIANNPDLQANEAAIRDLTKSSGLAPEDVIEKYGFKSKNKLAKAKGQGDIKGGPAPKAKTIAEMSPDEYEKFRKEQGIGTRGTFS